MSAPTPAAGAAATPTTELDGAKWLDKALDTARVDKEDTAARRRGSEALDQFISQAVKPGQALSKEVETTINFWTPQITKNPPSHPNHLTPPPPLHTNST